MSNLIHEGNVWATADEPLRGPISTILRYRPAGYLFVPAYKKGYWDGWRTMYDARNHRFPAGLIPYVIRELQERGIEFVLMGDAAQLTPPSIDYCLRPVKSDIKLMPHQARAIEKALQWPRGIFQHPVGAGKSFTLIETVRAIGAQALVLVHTTDLMDQIADDFKLHLNAPGIVGIAGAGEWSPHCITVATFQTVVSRMKRFPEETFTWLAEMGQIHVDEAHHAGAETFASVLRATPNAYWRYGYSATPYKSGDTESELQVMAWLGPVLDEMTPVEGVEVGRLTEVDLFMVEMEGWEPKPVYRTDKNGKKVQMKPFAYDAAVAALLIDHEWRNDAITKIAQRFRQVGGTLIFVERLEHGRKLAEMLDCPFLEGASKRKDRQDGWKALREGTLDLAVTSKIADEGLNIPNLRFVIMAGGGKAQHKLIQRLGRGRRAVEGKDRLFAVDFADKGMNLGPHTKERLKAYRSDTSINVTECTLEEILA